MTYMHRRWINFLLYTLNFHFAHPHANIVQTVKKCYKLKIDSRELKSRFWWFFHSYSSHFLSLRASLPSQRTTFGRQGSPFALQNDYCWIAKGVHLQWNVFLLCNRSLHIFSENIVICCATAYYAKPLKTREFRAKDFLARSVRSFERLKMQILCWDVGQKPHPRPLPRREGSNMHCKK